MRRLQKTIVLFFLLLFLGGGRVVWGDRTDDLQRRINELQQKIASAQTQERTFSSEIERINNQISLTKLQIESTEAEIDRLSEGIATLSGKIGNLEDALAHNSEVIVHRITRSYIEGRDDPVLYLFSSSGIEDFFQRLDYLRIVQRHDRELLIQMELTKQSYRDQREAREDRKKKKEALSAQLTAQKNQLDRQNREKQALLEVTRNDERRYQQLLAFAQQELDALRTSQFTGKREVKKGEVIGLMGSTGNSTGPHLHFGVYGLSESQANSFNYLDSYEDPAGYLSPRRVDFDSYWSCDNTETRTFGSGQYEWPMSNPKISQCFSSTPYARTFPYGGVPFHHGVDMYDNNDLAIRAVDDGVAYFYRGTSSLGNNVRVFHGNGRMTLYLHLQ